jgi:hypothetical protein
LFALEASAQSPIPGFVAAALACGVGVFFVVGELISLDGVDPGDLILQRGVLLIQSGGG